jgi:hypothetical protein
MSDDAGLVLVGYGHASLLECLRPDLAYPGRKVRRAQVLFTQVFAQPCDCGDDHVEVWARRLP